MTKKKALKKEETKVPKALKKYQDPIWLAANYGKAVGKMSAGAIARQFEVTRTVVLYFLKKHGIKIVTRASVPKKEAAPAK